MKVGRVLGTVVSTIQHDAFVGRHLLLCRLLGADGGDAGYSIAIDVVGAGPGEAVLILDEGSSARQILEMATGPVRAVIVGIVDELHGVDIDPHAA